MPGEPANPVSHPTMLASNTPDPSSLGSWLIVLAFVLNLAISAVTFWAAISNRKQRREVTFGEVAASKEDFDKHVLSNTEDHQRFIEKLELIERNINQQNREDLSTLHDKINLVDRRVAGMETEVRILTRTMERVAEDLRNPRET